MSELAPLHLPPSSEPVRVAVRRLRWLRGAFADQLAAISAETGVEYTLDDRRLAAAFVSWLRRVDAQNPHDPARRRAFFDFAAGVMLHELIRAMPVSAGPPPADANRELPEYYWPEGFACTVFCVNMFTAVISQEFDATIDVVPAFFDIRSWWSFRENAAERVSSAIGFFDLFLGMEPDWEMPTVFRNKFARQLGRAGS